MNTKFRIIDNASWCCTVLLIPVATILWACRSGSDTAKTSVEVRSERPAEWIHPDSLTVQEFFSIMCGGEYDPIANFVSFQGAFPKNWASKTDTIFLKAKIASTKKCACYVNAMSSHIPLCDSADEGGYAKMILDQLSKGGDISFGLDACPKFDTIYSSAIKPKTEHTKNPDSNGIGSK